MYEKVPISSEYLLKINELESVKLVVLGKDPYPIKGPRSRDQGVRVLDPRNFSGCADCSD